MKTRYDYKMPPKNQKLNTPATPVEYIAEPGKGAQNEKADEDIKELVQALRDIMKNMEKMMDSTNKRHEKLEEILTGRLYRMEEKIESLENENKDLQHTIRILKEETADNVVSGWIKQDEELMSIQVGGLDFKNGDTPIELANRFMHETLGVTDIEPTSTFIQTNERGKKLKIFLKNKQEKIKLLTKGQRLKDTPIKMDCTHLPVVKQAIYELKQLCWNRRQKGEDARYNYLGVYINGNFVTNIRNHLMKTYLAKLSGQ